MSKQTNISPQKKPVATDELSEEALDQVAGGPASTPSMTTKTTAVSSVSQTTEYKTNPQAGPTPQQIQEAKGGGI